MDRLNSRKKTAARPSVSQKEKYSVCSIKKRCMNDNGELEDISVSQIWFSWITGWTDYNYNYISI